MINKRKIVMRLATIAIFTLWVLPGISQELTAKEIIRKADKKNRGETSQGIMEMKIMRPDWERTVEMKNWSKGDDFFLIYISAPAKDKGQVFLKREKEMWNWVPLH